MPGPNREVKVQAAEERATTLEEARIQASLEVASLAVQAAATENAHRQGVRMLEKT